MRTVRIKRHGDGWELAADGDRGGLLFADLAEAREFALAWVGTHGSCAQLVAGEATDDVTSTRSEAALAEAGDGRQ